MNNDHAPAAPDEQAPERPVARRGQIFRHLQAAILSGGFPAGQPLPPERELMRRYGVTRDTIRRALGKLTASGHLTCQPRIGYRVAAAFRAGRPARTHAIGLIWHNIAGLTRYPQLFTELEQATADIGCVLMVAASGGDAEHESETIRRLAAGGMEGLFMAPATRGKRSVELERWIRGGRPVVLHGHPGWWLLPEALAARCDWLDADNDDGIRQAVEMLAGLGHRTAGFVCREPLEGSERFESFKKWAGAFGLATEPRWWISVPVGGAATGRTAVSGLKSSGPMPTAVLCSHDDAATALVDALQEEGIRCPEDLSVVGFEGHALRGDAREARLTTVDIHTDRHAREAMRLLARRFAGDKGQPEHVRVPVSLVMRSTAGAPPQGRASLPGGTR